MRGGGPFDSGDDHIRRQGFSNGLFYDPNALNTGSPSELDTLLLLTAIFLSYLAAKKAGREQAGTAVGTALLTGVMTAAGIALLVAVGKTINLRMVFINASPSLYQILTFYLGPKPGIPLLLLSGVLSGLAAGVLFLGCVVIMEHLFLGGHEFAKRPRGTNQHLGFQWMADDFVGSGFFQGLGDL